MKNLKSKLKSLTTAAWLTGLVMNFNACSEQSPVSLESEDSVQTIQTNKGPVRRLQVAADASMLHRGSEEDNLFYKEQFMPAKKRGNIRLGNTYYGHSKVTFFRNSTLEDLTIQFEWLASTTFEGLLNNLEFGPHGATFNVPVRVQLSYKRADLTGVDETALQVYFFNEDTGLWELIGGEVDTENKLVIVYLDHFSRYAIGAE